MSLEKEKNVPIQFIFRDRGARDYAAGKMPSDLVKDSGERGLIVSATTAFRVIDALASAGFNAGDYQLKFGKEARRGYQQSF